MKLTINTYGGQVKQTAVGTARKPPTSREANQSSYLQIGKLSNAEKIFFEMSMRNTAIFKRDHRAGAIHASLVIFIKAACLCGKVSSFSL
jgi:hypothetical protein